MSRRRRRKNRSSGRQRGLFVIGIVLTAVAVALVSSGEEAELPAATVVEVPEGRVRVEVLNGGGVSGMAREATRRLRRVGFDVVDFGNAASFDSVRPSAVVDRVGRTDVARAVAIALGIDNVQSEPDPNLYVDVSVLLGGEWRPAQAGAAGAEGEVRRWWDPRGWLGR